jgi:phospholipid/cholesterol/gamma-HCH transport system substrate-binding protein
MFKQLEGARLGLFVFIGTVLMVLSIFLLGNKEKLFSSTIEIKAYFNQIEGLKPGAPVRLSGYDVGSVSNISLSSDTTGRVEVRMRIDNTLKQFIRMDSKASIETEGLVGKKIVTINPGTSDAAVITEGGILQSKNPVNVSAIIEETQAIMKNVKNLSGSFADVFEKINKGEGSIGKLVNDDALYNSTVSITQTADKSLTAITKRMDQISDIIVDATNGVKKIINNVDETLVDVRHLVNQIENGEGVLGKLIADKSMGDSVKAMISNLAKTTEATRIASVSFADNMEALKHNWLFKSYFEQRGYWNTTEYEKVISNQIDEMKKQQEILKKMMDEMRELKASLDQKK